MFARFKIGVLPALFSLFCGVAVCGLGAVVAAAVIHFGGMEERAIAASALFVAPFGGGAAGICWRILCGRRPVALRFLLGIGTAAGVLLLGAAATLSVPSLSLQSAFCTLLSGVGATICGAIPIRGQ